LLAEKIRPHEAQTWLVNTGWSGGGYGIGSRIELAHTRAILDAIHSGALLEAEVAEDPTFGLQVPTSCPNVPRKILIPRETWADKAAHDETAGRLLELFQNNFRSMRTPLRPNSRAARPGARFGPERPERAFGERHRAVRDDTLKAFAPPPQRGSDNA
jgi:phosphoenolpyruvate carboxykinase (ATP)